jgi:hypothetical protein
MVMPLAGRGVAAVAGGLLVIVAVSSVTVTLIVSRQVNSRLTRRADRTVDWVYEQVVTRFADFHRRDQLRATQAAALLLAQLAVWLIVAYVGFALLLWPFARHGVVSAFIDAGSSLFTLGFVARMREVGFPIERDPAEAWPDFVGWRVNYGRAAYAVAAAVYAVPALWSGPRRHAVSPIPPLRPAPGNPPA